MIMWCRVFTEPRCSWIHGWNPSISLQHFQPRHDSYFFLTGSVLSWHKHWESSEEQAAQLWMAMVEQVLFLQNYDGLYPTKIFFFPTPNRDVQIRGKTLLRYFLFTWCIFKEGCFGLGSLFLYQPQFCNWQHADCCRGVPLCNPQDIIYMYV